MIDPPKIATPKYSCVKHVDPFRGKVNLKIRLKNNLLMPVLKVGMKNEG